MSRFCIPPHFLGIKVNWAVACVTVCVLYRSGQVECDLSLYVVQLIAVRFCVEWSERSAASTLVLQVLEVDTDRGRKSHFLSVVFSSTTGV